MPEVFVGNLTCDEGKNANQKVEFDFNPSEYKITKANKYNPSANKGGNVPKWEFAGGDPRVVVLELFFDSYLPRENSQGKKVKVPDLRTEVNKLFSFMVVDETLKAQDGRDSHMGRPPRCRLEWARESKYHFSCYITHCEVRYTMFTPNGEAVRATATLHLQEAVDPTKPGGTNPTSRGEPGRRMWTIQEGDRLDWIAYREYGDASEWRRIAVANRLFNPLDLRPGMVLAIPPR
jgi:hypothetical protein